MMRATLGFLAICVVGCGPDTERARSVGDAPSSARVASVDTTAPSGTVRIAEGASAVASTRVVLELSASDDTAVTEMCVSNTASCTAWTTYAPTLSWVLPSAGSKTVHVRFRDAAGNVSAVATDSVLVDLTRPTDGGVSVVGSDGTLALTWSGFSDAGAGLASYVVVGTAESAVAPSCGRAVALYTGTSPSAELTGLTNGATYALRVCAVDGAGNVSTGVTTTGRPAPSYETPTGSVALDGGAVWTRARTVSATLSAEGATDVVEACVVDGTRCLRWVPMAETVSVGLTTAQGTHTVRAWFRDAWGNETASPVTASIALDSVGPTGGTLTATGSDSTVALGWTGFADATSGVASYVVVAEAGDKAPSKCDSGTRLYAGSATSLSHTSLTNGTTWSYRVCAVDVAGNTGAGVTATARPAPDHTAPTGTILLANGAAWTRAADVTVALTASGATDITGVCLSETTRCTRWLPYAASTTFRVRTTAGTHRVYAWFRDAWGNVSATPASDTIGMDRTKPPVEGRVSATPGAGRVSLSWTGFSDGAGGSGVSTYRVVAAAGRRAPSSCSSGTFVYEGAAAQATHRNAAVGTTYQYRVCAIDLVGNVSRGATASATVTTANQVPTAPEIALSSTTPAEGDALTCSVTTPATDADGDAVSYVFAWDVDGEAYEGATQAGDGLSSTVPADVTAEGETWTCAVEADDGGAYGPAVEATGTVRGAGPSWTQIWFDPLSAERVDWSFWDDVGQVAPRGEQGVASVGGRLAWQQRETYDSLSPFLVVPVSRSTTDLEALEIDVWLSSAYDRSDALFVARSYGNSWGAPVWYAAVTGPGYWEHSVDGFGSVLTLERRYADVFSLDHWHTLRVEFNERWNEVTVLLDGSILSQSISAASFWDLQRLRDPYVWLRVSRNSFAAWSNLVVYQGARPTPDCDIVTREDVEYMFCRDRQTFRDAAYNCEADNGTGWPPRTAALWVPRDEQESEWMHQARVSLGLEREPMWINLVDMEVDGMPPREGSWNEFCVECGLLGEWFYRSRSRYTNWSAGQPDNGLGDEEQDCAAFRGGGPEWVDASCEDTYAYVCKVMSI